MSDNFSDITKALREEILREISESYESCAYTNDMGYINGLKFALRKIRELDNTCT